MNFLDYIDHKTEDSMVGVIRRGRLTASAAVRIGDLNRPKEEIDAVIVDMIRRTVYGDLEEIVDELCRVARMADPHAENFVNELQVRSMKILRQTPK